MSNFKIGIAVASCSVLLVIYMLYSNYLLQREQLQDYQEHAGRLEVELERNGDTQVQYETEINRLNRQINNQQAAISRLEEELDTALDQIDPDITLLEQQIRERILVEVQSQPEVQQLSRLELVKELTSLDPLEMAQLMSLQSQYGGFLQSLDVDDERLEVIADALLNQITELNQRRMEIFQARTSGNPVNIQEIQRIMQEINSPESQRESLSYVFTADEMAAFERYQETLPPQGGLSSATFIGSPSGDVIQAGGSLGVSIPGSQNRSATIQLITPETQNSGTSNN